MLTQISTLLGATQGIAIVISSILMTVAFIVFLLAVIFYINKRRSGDADGFRQAGNMLLGSVFALFIMVAVWGLVFFLSSSLGIGIGGCTSRPSTLPGVANNVDCGAGSSGSRTTQSGPSGSGRQISIPESNSRSAPTQPAITNPSAANNGATCSSGSGKYAANGDLMYCNFGQRGDVCITGSCRVSECLKEDQSLTYGLCQ
jgi:hypothetical protein